jgi:hypothetical protein
VVSNVLTYYAPFLLMFKFAKRNFMDQNFLPRTRASPFSLVEQDHREIVHGKALR